MFLMHTVLKSPERSERGNISHGLTLTWGKTRKRKCRCERKFRKSKLDSDSQMYLQQKINTCKVIEEAKADYYKVQLEGADAKTIFATLNDLLGRNSRSLPNGDDPKVRSEKFSKFFIDKIQMILKLICKCQTRFQLYAEQPTFTYATCGVSEG